MSYTPWYCYCLSQKIKTCTSLMYIHQTYKTFKGRDTAQELSKVKIDLVPVLYFSRPSWRIRFGYVTRTNSSNITSPETNWPRGNGMFWEHRQPSYRWDNILGNRKSFMRLSRAPSLSLSRHWMSSASCSVYCKTLGCFQWYVPSCGRQMLLLSFQWF